MDPRADASIGDIYSAGADVTLTFKIQGYQWGQGQAPDIPGEWDFVWEYSDDNGSTWETSTPITSYTGITGDTEIFYEPGYGFDYSYSISEQRTYVWTTAPVRWARS